jgi:hypothetical protein
MRTAIEVSLFAWIVPFEKGIKVYEMIFKLGYHFLCVSVKSITVKDVVSEESRQLVRDWDCIARDIYF